MIDHVWSRILRIVADTILSDSEDLVAIMIYPGVFLIDHGSLRPLRIIEDTIMFDSEDLVAIMIYPGVFMMDPVWVKISMIFENTIMDDSDDPAAIRINPAVYMMDHTCRRTLRIAENTIMHDSEDSEQSMINPTVFMIDHDLHRTLRIFENTIMSDPDDPVAIRICPAVSMIDHDFLRMLRIIENTIMFDSDDPMLFLINPIAFSPQKKHTVLSVRSKYYHFVLIRCSMPCLRAVFHTYVHNGIRITGIVGSAPASIFYRCGTVREKFFIGLTDMVNSLKFTNTCAPFSDRKLPASFLFPETIRKLESAKLLLSVASKFVAKRNTGPLCFSFIYWDFKLTQQ